MLQESSQNTTPSAIETEKQLIREMVLKNSQEAYLKWHEHRLKCWQDTSATKLDLLTPKAIVEYVLTLESFENCYASFLYELTEHFNNVHPNKNDSNLNELAEPFLDLLKKANTESAKFMLVLYKTKLENRTKEDEEWFEKAYHDALVKPENEKTSWTYLILGILTDSKSAKDEVIKLFQKSFNHADKNLLGHLFIAGLSTNPTVIENEAQIALDGKITSPYFILGKHCLQEFEKTGVTKKSQDLKKIIQYFECASAGGNTHSPKILLDILSRYKNILISISKEFSNKLEKYLTKLEEYVEKNDDVQSQKRKKILEEEKALIKNMVLGEKDALEKYKNHRKKQWDDPTTIRFNLLTPTEVLSAAVEYGQAESKFKKCDPYFLYELSERFFEAKMWSVEDKVRIENFIKLLMETNTDIAKLLIVIYKIETTPSYKRLSKEDQEWIENIWDESHAATQKTPTNEYTYLILGLITKAGYFGVYKAEKVKKYYRLSAANNPMGDIYYADEENDIDIKIERLRKAAQSKISVAYNDLGGALVSKDTSLYKDEILCSLELAVAYGYNRAITNLIYLNKIYNRTPEYTKKLERYGLESDKTFKLHTQSKPRVKPNIVDLDKSISGEGILISENFIMTQSRYDELCNFIKAKSGELKGILLRNITFENTLKNANELCGAILACSQLTVIHFDHLTRPAVDGKPEAVKGFSRLLDKLSDLKNLESLTLDDCFLQDSSLFGILPYIGATTKLKKLSLSRNGLSSDFLIPLMQTIIQNVDSTLESFDISDETSTNQSVMNLVNNVCSLIQKHKKLKSFAFRSQYTEEELTDAHFIKICTELELSTVQEIDLLGVRSIKRTGYNALLKLVQKNTHIISFKFYENNCPKFTLKEIKIQLENNKINHTKIDTVQKNPIETIQGKSILKLREKESKTMPNSSPIEKEKYLIEQIVLGNESAFLEYKNHREAVWNDESAEEFNVLTPAETLQHVIDLVNNKKLSLKTCNPYFLFELTESISSKLSPFEKDILRLKPLFLELLKKHRDDESDIFKFLLAFNQYSNKPLSQQDYGAFRTLYKTLDKKRSRDKTPWTYLILGLIDSLNPQRSNFNTHFKEAMRLKNFLGNILLSDSLNDLDENYQVLKVAMEKKLSSAFSHRAITLYNFYKAKTITLPEISTYVSMYEKAVIYGSKLALLDLLGYAKHLRRSEKDNLHLKSEKYIEKLERYCVKSQLRIDRTKKITDYQSIFESQLTDDKLTLNDFRFDKEAMKAFSNFLELNSQKIHILYFEHCFFDTQSLKGLLDLNSVITKQLNLNVIGIHGRQKDFNQNDISESDISQFLELIALSKSIKSIKLHYTGFHKAHFEKLLPVLRFNSTLEELYVFEEFHSPAVLFGVIDAINANPNSSVKKITFKHVETSSQRFSTSDFNILCDKLLHSKFRYIDIQGISTFGEAECTYLFNLVANNHFIEELLFDENNCQPYFFYEIKRQLGINKDTNSSTVLMDESFTLNPDYILQSLSTNNSIKSLILKNPILTNKFLIELISIIENNSCVQLENLDITNAKHEDPLYENFLESLRDFLKNTQKVKRFSYHGFLSRENFIKICEDLKNSHISYFDFTPTCISTEDAEVVLNLLKANTQIKDFKFDISLCSHGILEKINKQLESNRGNNDIYLPQKISAKKPPATSFLIETPKDEGTKTPRESSTKPKPPEIDSKQIPQFVEPIEPTKKKEKRNQTSIKYNWIQLKKNLKSILKESEKLKEKYSDCTTSELAKIIKKLEEYIGHIKKEDNSYYDLANQYYESLTSTKALEKLSDEFAIERQKFSDQQKMEREKRLREQAQLSTSPILSPKPTLVFQLKFEAPESKTKLPVKNTNGYHGSPLHRPPKLDVPVIKMAEQKPEVDSEKQEISEFIRTVFPDLYP